MNEPTPPIAGQAARLTTCRVNTADEATLICVVHLNTSPAYAECSVVAKSGAARTIGRSPAGWRIDSASAEAYADGTVRMWLSAWPEDASGTQAAVRWVDFPNALAILPPSGADYDARATIKGVATILTRYAQSEEANADQLAAALAPLVPK